LTFILPGRPIENKFSFTTATWPRYGEKKVKDNNKLHN